MLDRVDAGFAQGCFEILDTLAITAQPASEGGHGFTGDFFVAKLAGKKAPLTGVM